MPRKQSSLPQHPAPGAELPPPTSVRCLSRFSLTSPRCNWMWSQFCTTPGAGTAATAQQHPPLPAMHCLGKHSLSPGGFKPLGVGVTPLPPRGSSSAPSYPCLAMLCPGYHSYSLGLSTADTNLKKIVLWEHLTVITSFYLQLNHSWGGKEKKRSKSKS